jgi:hypothetical protein
MNKRALTIGFIVGLIASFFVAASSTPAQAYTGVHNVSHFAPDDGYDDPIIIGTAWSNGQMTGSVYSIGEGYGRGGVAAVYVPAGHDYRCSTNGTDWNVLFTATGWQKTWSSMTCVDQANN